MSTPPDPGYDALDAHAANYPKPGDDGPDEEIIDLALAYESALALNGWDLTPQILWVRQPPGQEPLIGPAPGPRALLRAGQIAEAAIAFAQTLARIGDTATEIVPADIAAVALTCEAWAVPKPDEATAEELAHLRELRDAGKLYTRPERVEQRYLHLVDLKGNEADIRRSRGTGDEPDLIEVRAWGAARIAHFYRGEVPQATRELAAVIRQVTGGPGPPPHFRTVFGLN